MIWDSVPTFSLQGVATQSDSFQKIEKCPNCPAYARCFGVTSPPDGYWGSSEFRVPV